VIPPAIYDPGQFNLQWLLDRDENIEDIINCPYLTEQEIEEVVNKKSNVD
jgi:hypothetical protein